MKKKNNIANMGFIQFLKCVAASSIIEVIWYLLAGGWLFMYDSIGFSYDWENSDTLWIYSLNMFLVVVLGAVIEVFVLAAILGCAIGALAFVIHLWYIAIPLVLLFLGILFFRWNHLRNIKSVMKENKRK